MFKTVRRSALIGAMLSSLLLLILSDTQIKTHIDESWNDWLVRLNAVSQTPSSQILIVDIDDKSLYAMEAIAGKWPWPRSIHALLIEGLSEYHPKAIVFDILFAEQDVYRPDSDRYFAESLTPKNSVYLAGSVVANAAGAKTSTLSDVKDALSLTKTSSADPAATASLVLPWIIEQDDWRVGSINFSLSEDGVGRLYPVYHNLSGWHWLSLPAIVARDLGISLPDQEDIRLRWLGEHTMSFQHVSYSDVFSHLEEDVDKKYSDLFENKIILIGSSATGLFDARPTPVSQNHPAIAILATALDNLIESRYYKDIDAAWGNLLGILLTSFFFYFMWISPKYRSLFVVYWPLFLLSSSSILLFSWLSVKNGFVFSVAFTIVFSAFSLLIVTLLRGFTEYLQRLRLVGLFSRFMDPRVVNQLINKHQLEISTQSKSCEVTILFSDIRGFTTLSEKNTPEAIVNILNQYFSLQVETIFKYGGTLDKFIGDAIMAFWGAPVDDPKQAENAILAAIEMTENLKKFRQTLPSEMRDFDVGIGLHTGIAVVGMIGSEKRYDYTAIGDTVNLASRIEGLTKDRARILISEDCKDKCGNNFSWQPMGSFTVKGRTEPVNIFSIEGGEL
ncbi:adenylate/guanylate cyclase domain-containing protein [Pleionea sediminis]|uniref:adenylate/guanylate cyclase domain-containing protein n=1 Tax=Pleionea sediminis TaxID=2569479 RepID=UPI001186DD3E|nr:adenylate/guanylate cyclase domain-containing protein [Pleionea sediminis]